MNDYSFILNIPEGKTCVFAIDDGHDAILNNTAGSIFEKLSSGERSLAELNLMYPAFIRECESFNWIENLRLNGTFIRIDKGPHLKHVQIELTRHCNLRCTYCYSSSGPYIKNKLELQRVFDLLDEARQMGVIWIDFTGGEPLLYPNWQLVFKKARDLGFIVSVHTNGLLLDFQNLSSLKSIRIRHLQISLDSHMSEIHDHMRGMNGAFEKTIRNIRLAQELGFNIRVSIVAHKSNMETYRSSVLWLEQELNVEVVMDRVVSLGRETESNTGIKTKEYYELIAPLLSRNIDESKLCQSASKQESKIIVPHCGIGVSYVYITADGEIALCPTMTSRDGKIFQNPNVNNLSLSEAWYDSVFFNTFRYVNCKNIKVCPAAEACGGGCRSNAYIEGESINSPDILSCNIHKNPKLEFKEFDYSTI